jgi:peptidoglycan/LPS O-acetylase OafA/YrhL
LQKEWAKTGNISLRDFYLRRILRIFPAFYTYLMVLAVLSVAGFLSIAWSHFLDAGLFLWNYKHIWDSSVGEGNWLLGHIWTLSLEEQFYLLWPLSLLLLRPRGAMWLALALIFVMPSCRIASYFLLPAWRGQLLMMLHTGADAIMFGCFLALTLNTARVSGILYRFRHPIWPIFSCLFVWMVSPTIGILLPGHLGGGYEISLGRSLAGMCVAFLVAWLLKHPESLAGKLLNSRLMIHLGVLSYSLYLWNPLFLTSPNKTWTGIFPLNLVCTYLAALLCYHLIEKRFLKMKGKFSAKRALIE